MFAPRADAESERVSRRTSLRLRLKWSRELRRFVQGFWVDTTLGGP